MNAILSEQSLAKVRNILEQQLGVAPDQITPEARLTDDLGADSLDMLEIGMTVEETFNLSIPDEEMEHVRTVGDLHEDRAVSPRARGRDALCRSGKRSGIA